MDENGIGKHIVDAAIQIHREIGPGLLESVYEAILFHYLESQSFNVERQVQIPIRYRGLMIEDGFRADLIVDNKVIVELKCVENLNNLHHKQLLTYLRMADLRLGYLLNFSGALMKDGIHRKVNGLTE